jgi:hypothetical protein
VTSEAAVLATFMLVFSQVSNQPEFAKLTLQHPRDLISSTYRIHKTKYIFTSSHV